MQKKSFLFQWDYMTNCYENENDNGKMDHINKNIKRPRHRHRCKYTKYSVSR